MNDGMTIEDSSDEPKPKAAISGAHVRVNSGDAVKADGEPVQVSAGPSPDNDAAPETDVSPKRVPLEERHPELEWIGARFAMLIDALRDMADEVVPHLENLDTSRLSPAALAAVDAMPEPQRASLEEALRLMHDLSDPGDEDGLQSRVRAINESFEAAFQGDRQLLGTFMDSFRSAHEGPDRTSILRNSLLLQAVAGFEVLVAGVATRFFLTQPKALESAEKEFSLADLREFDDVEDAIDALIARRVTALMRGDSLDGWADWIKRRAKVDLRQFAMDWDAVVEVFQRRHVIIHNGGLASRQYLSNVAPRLRRNVVVGGRLRVDDDYLHRAFDDLDIVAAALIGVISSKWNKDKDAIDKAGGQLTKRTYSLLRRARWEAVAKLAEVRSDVPCRASNKEAMRANSLYARRVLHGPDSVSGEARDWDVSDKAGRFKLVRIVILQEMDEAFEMIPGLIERQELSLGELLTWPILNDVRVDARWDGLAAQLGIGQDAHEPSE